MLELTFTMDLRTELVATRFTHPRLKERERRAERGQEDGEFRWTQSLKALCILLLRYAAWARKGEGDEPVLEGRRPSPATSLNDSLSKCTDKWLEDIFGKDGGTLIVLSLLHWKNRDTKTTPGGPVRLLLNTKNLAASEIAVVVDGSREESPDRLLALARGIEKQHWGDNPKGRHRTAALEDDPAVTSGDETPEYPPAPLPRPGPGRDVAAPVPCNLPPPPGLLVGREDALRELRARLGQGGRIVVMRGWPGVGKSTAAVALAHDAGIREALPDGVLWTSLGQRPDLLFELNRWLRVLTDDFGVTIHDIKEAFGRLSFMLRDRRMLLIVDDVWEAAHVQALRVGGRSCSTLVVTRSPAVAQAVAPSPEATYVLPILDEQSGLELLSHLAPSVVKEHPGEARDLARELEGLPLALQVAGRLLNAEAVLGWSVDRLLGELRQESRLLSAHAPPDCAELLSETTPTVAALLRKSTDRLSSQARECFAMLGAFAPKPATFDIDAIAAVWELSNPRPIVRELAARGLLEPVGCSRFQMHALLVSHAKSLCSE